MYTVIHCYLQLLTPNPNPNPYSDPNSILFKWVVLGIDLTLIDIQAKPGLGLPIYWRQHVKAVLFPQLF